LSVKRKNGWWWEVGLGKSQNDKERNRLYLMPSVLRKQGNVCARGKPAAAMKYRL